MSNEKSTPITWCIVCGLGLKPNGNCRDAACDGHFTECAHGHEPEGCGKCHPPVPRAVAPSPVVMPEALAAEIRRVDGNHSLGAAALAEALMPFLRSLSSPAPVEGEVWQTMESAPKDGTEILGYYGITYPDLTRPPWDKDCMVISWCDDAFKDNKAWRNNGGGAMIEPKLWMRLDSLRASALSRLEREAKGE